MLIQVLQEVAAARHVLILCGSMEIDGYAFSLGLEFLRDFHGARLDLQNLIQPVTYLIREAIFRPKYASSRLGKVSLDICPLGALIDMYHTHEATNRHDKIYALLGMSSDDLSTAGLFPDYQVPWEELLQRLVKFLLGKQVSVKTWNNREMAIINSRGYVLGQVSSVKSDQDGRQSVNINFKNTLQHLGHTKEYEAHWNLQASAKSVQDGDIVCLLQGASMPTIIRLYEDHFAVIMIAAAFPEAMGTKSDSDRWPDFSHDFPLVWNWEKASDRLQDQEEYESLIEANRRVPERSQKELEDYIRKATRLSTVALILEDLEEYKEAEKRLKEAIEGYKRELGKEHLHTLKLIDKLAIIYKKSQQWKEAGELFSQVIQTRKCVQGEEHSDIFCTLTNLVSTYRDQGYLKGIEELEVITDLLKQKEHAAQITEKEVVRIAQSSKEVMTLLLNQRGGDVPITKGVVEAAAGNRESGKEIMTLLLDRRGGDVPITEGVVEAAAGNGEGGKEIMTLLLDRRGGDVPIAEGVVEAAAGNGESGKEIMTLLLDRRGGDIPITEGVVKAAASNRESGEEIMALLLNRRGGDAPITDGVVAQIARNFSKEMMTLLLDQRGGDVPITEEVVEAAAGNWESGKEIMALLLNRRGGDVPITEMVVKAAAGNREGGKEIMTLLLDRRGGDVPITEGVVEAAAGKWESGKEIMALLLDRRGGDVLITKGVVKAAAGNRESGKEIMALLLDRRGGDVPIAERVVSTGPKGFGAISNNRGVVLGGALSHTQVIGVSCLHRCSLLC